MTWQRPSPPSSSQKGPAHGFSDLRQWLLVALLGFILLVAGWVGFRLLFSVGPVPVDQAESSSRELAPELLLHALNNAYQRVSQQVAPAVVHIDVHREPGRQPADDELSQLFGPQASMEFSSQGSGVVVDDDGLVLTNFHVVHGALKIDVIFSDGRRLPAEVVGSDALTDLALLKIPARGLAAARWGDSDQLEVGALVWAVGSPFGLDQSVTAGIVSAKNRNVGAGSATFPEFLQTDAAVNPGNSGGPLVDVTGRVVGINTAIVGKEFRGVSFAIPSNVAQQVYQRLRTEGLIVRGWIGVQLGDDGQRSAGEPSGARVRTVVNDAQTPSPAQRAGIRGGDLIVRWNGQPVEGAIQLRRLVAQTDAGREVTVEVLRGDQQLQLRVEVAEQPASR